MHSVLAESFEEFERRRDLVKVRKPDPNPICRPTLAPALTRSPTSSPTFTKVGKSVKFMSSCTAALSKMAEASKSAKGLAGAAPPADESTGAAGPAAARAAATTTSSAPNPFSEEPAALAEAEAAAEAAAAQEPPDAAAPPPGGARSLVVTARLLAADAGSQASRGALSVSAVRMAQLGQGETEGEGDAREGGGNR